MKMEPKVPLWKKVVATVAAVLTVGGAGAGIAANQAKKVAEKPSPPPITQVTPTTDGTVPVLPRESVRGKSNSLPPPIIQVTPQQNGVVPDLPR